MNFTKPMIAVIFLASICFLASFSDLATAFQDAAQPEPENLPRASSAVRSQPAIPGTTDPFGWTPRLNSDPFSPGVFGYSSSRASSFRNHFDSETAKKIQELAQQDQKMDRTSRNLVREYGSVKDDETRNKAKETLAELVAKHFDTRQERRELELKSIEQRVKRLRETYEKRQEARQTIIDKRLDQLTSEAEGLAF